MWPFKKSKEFELPEAWCCDRCGEREKWKGDWPIRWRSRRWPDLCDLCDSIIREEIEERKEFAKKSVAQLVKSGGHPYRDGAPDLDQAWKTAIALTQSNPFRLEWCDKYIKKL